MAYAIFKTGGKQYKVAEGDKIEVEKLDIEIGKSTTFDSVLFYSEGETVKIGDPLISGARVTAEVLDQVRAKKVTAFKFRRRQGYHKTKGHRQPLTRLSITGISV